MRDVPVDEEDEMLPVQQSKHRKEGFLGAAVRWMRVQQTVGMREMQERNKRHAPLCPLLRRMQGQEGRTVRQVQQKLHAGGCQATERGLIAIDLI